MLLLCVVGGIGMEKIKVDLLGEVLEVEKETTLYQLSQTVKGNYEEDIILATKNGKLCELTKTLEDGDVIDFITIKETAGFNTYRRGVTMMLIKAIYQIAGPENLERVSIEHSLGAGYYGKIKGDVIADVSFFEKVEKKMREIVEADIPFEKYSVHTREAVRKFHNYKMYDKESLLRYRRTSFTNIYNLTGFENYFFGYMPFSTGILKYFKVFPYEDGFILQLPRKEEPTVVPKFEPREKLFKTLREACAWNETMGIETVGDLNSVILSGEISDLMMVQEALQEKKISHIAERIASDKTKKFVMIAGPSSSGKTTFSHKLSIQLRTYGLKPHPIAVDDYFVDREKTPLNEDGTYNFECLEAIDIEKFNEDMTALLRGERVELPTFNFKTGKREYKGNYKQLGADDILVIEGIHGLNNKLSYSLPEESKFKVYISALTTLNIDEHNQIATSDGRLLRRMVRDARTRGASAEKTISMWKSVRNGEENYIFPFQESADVMFNSALIYELAVLKQYAEPLLFGIKEDSPYYIEANRLLKFLDYLVGVSSEDVPKTSLVREFIGNSYFHI